MEWIIFHHPPLPQPPISSYAPFQPADLRHELLLHHEFISPNTEILDPIAPMEAKTKPIKQPNRRIRQSSPTPSGFRRQAVSNESVSTLFEDLQVSADYATPNPNPRSFPYSVKQLCWEKAEKIKGRDPDRWRRDYLGNIVFRKLVGCAGCLCHDYDHILPYSKGGQSTLGNCQVLQARVNRSKGNQTDISKADLIRKSSYCRVSGRDMDLLELSAYGDVHHAKETGGCRIQ